MVFGTAESCRGVFMRAFLLTFLQVCDDGCCYANLSGLCQPAQVRSLASLQRKSTKQNSKANSTTPAVAFCHVSTCVPNHLAGGSGTGGDSPQSVTQSKMCLFSSFEAGAGYWLSVQLAFVFCCGICELSFVRKAPTLPPEPWVGIGWSACGSHDRPQAESWWFSSVPTHGALSGSTWIQSDDCSQKKWPTLPESSTSITSSTSRASATLLVGPSVSELHMDSE